MRSPKVTGSEVKVGSNMMETTKRSCIERLNLRRNGICYALVLTLVLALKVHYSRADGEDLIWILGPTAKMVGILSGHRFVYEAHTGFINTGLQAIIAPSCAGINFLIAALCMIAFTGLFSLHHPSSRWWWAVISFPAAYVLTLCVNTLRILVSVYFPAAAVHTGLLSHDSMHRLQGITVFFVSLSLVYFLLQKVIPIVNRHVQSGGTEKIHRKSPVIHRLISGFVPVCWYLAVALGIPIVNGTFRTHTLHPNFMAHGLTVVFACLVAFAVVFLIRLMFLWITDSICQKKIPF